jgi:hypothetical protein
MEACRLRWMLFVSALVACNGGGFKEVADAGPAADAEGRSDGAPDGTGPSCQKLSTSAGPVVLGFGDADSRYSALATSPGRVAAVWEKYYPSGDDAGKTVFAVQNDSGKITTKGLVLDQSEYPPLPAMVAIQDSFAVVHVRKQQTQDLQYLRVDPQGQVLKQKVLASGLGQYAVEPTIASGKAGVAVGYTMYDQNQRGQIYLGKISADGDITKAFTSFTAAGKERRHLQLQATDTGFIAAWSESRPSDRWAVMVAWLDSALLPVSPGPVVVAEDQRIHRRPKFAQLGQTALVCHESLDSGQDADISCRTVKPGGTLGKNAVSTLPGLSSQRPQVAVLGSGFAMLWTGKTTGLEEVHARLFSADGVPLGPAHRVSEPSLRSWNPSVISSGDALVAAWYRYIPITVYFASFRLTCAAPAP